MSETFKIDRRKSIVYPFGVYLRRRWWVFVWWEELDYCMSLNEARASLGKLSQCALPIIKVVP